ncbi:MAG TPA: YceI family protein [Candidimonas sp.]|nr:YceI family protein [Candidimonas sp.]
MRAHLLLRRITLAALLMPAFAGMAQAAPYTTLDAAASRISFSYSQMSVAMDGMFGTITATQFDFDPSTPDAAKVVLEIPLASVDAGYSEANAEVEKKEWLHTNAHPLARFESSKVEALGDRRYQVTGMLTIKGKSNEVTAPFSFTEKGAAGQFDGEFTFKRADFGIGEGMWSDFDIVANDITVKFSVIAGQ